MTLGGRPGRVIGARYRLINRLGSGGYGHVWKAYDETLHVDVAIKEVRLPSTVSDTERAERLVRAAREARKAAALRDHPNVVAVHDVVIEDEISWTVMQLVVGHSLKEQLNTRGPLSTDDAGKVATALLKALGAAQAAGIVHRDVKPGNVMLADNGEVLLTDFGIAVHPADTALTATGLVIGSAEYIAPERVEGMDGQPASDLFSLGVTLYQAVEGVSPFLRDTPGATLMAVLAFQPQPPQRAGHLAPLITRLLNKAPDKRPTTAEALALISATSPSPAPPAPEKTKIMSKPRNLTQGPRGPRVTVNLSSGQAINLEKQGGGTLTAVRIGLGWRAAPRIGLFGKRNREIDMDTSAVLFAGVVPVDIVFFRHLVSDDGSVRHTGDHLVG